MTGTGQVHVPAGIETVSPSVAVSIARWTSVCEQEAAFTSRPPVGVGVGAGVVGGVVVVGGGGGGVCVDVSGGVSVFVPV
jgi:hypothetical protein